MANPFAAAVGTGVSGSALRRMGAGASAAGVAGTGVPASGAGVLAGVCAGSRRDADPRAMDRAVLEMALMPR